MLNFIYGRGTIGSVLVFLNIFLSLEGVLPAIAKDSPGIKVDIGVAETIKELRNVWEFILYNKNTKLVTKNKESIYNICLGYSEISANMDVYADTAASMVGKTNEDKVRLSKILGEIIDKIYNSKSKIEDSVYYIDKEWAIDNISRYRSVELNMSTRGMKMEEMRFFSKKMMLTPSFYDDNAISDHASSVREFARTADSMSKDISSTLTDQ